MKTSWRRSAARPLICSSAASAGVPAAIENQLGLKYFAGCAEDHLDSPYYGIEGLYGERTAVTFGRKELAALLTRAGFSGQEWHYPFPDYKLPSVVVSEPALSLAQFDVPSLLFRARSLDYRGNLKSGNG